MIIGAANKLKNTPYGINKDFPKEITSARSQLWPLYKTERAKNTDASVYIGFPAKLVVRGRVVWYPASLCVRKVDVWHNRKMAAYTDPKQNGCSLYKAYGSLTKSVIATDRGPANCRHSADISPNSYRFRKYSSEYLPWIDLF